LAATIPESGFDEIEEVLTSADQSPQSEEPAVVRLDEPELANELPNAMLKLKRKQQVDIYQFFLPRYNCLI
jgi:hypothetical protein